MKAGLRVGSRYRLLDNNPNTLGRDWDCQIVLNDPQCSRVHAVILKDGGEWWIRDNASSNGTFVNGQRVDNARLVEGTLIRVGGSEFAFQEATADEPPPPVDAQQSTRQTIILEEQFDALETGDYTLGFLKDHKGGSEFFFLLQLSVKLLSVESPDEVISICLSRLHERVDATVSGLMWLSENGELKPKVVFPREGSGRIRLNDKLTERVVRDKKVIRIEHGTSHHGSDFADSVCIPLIDEGKTLGALHLYRQKRPFPESHFHLASSVANLLIRSLVRANRQAVIQADNQRLATASADTGELLGTSQAMQTLKSKIARIARAQGCVLVRGESGVGKELVSRAIQRSGHRADRPMLSVNCAAIPRDLMESQLFGHKKGAFTSADRDHAGWFQQADLGTLFLDEVGELTLDGQAKLLRILEGHPFFPVGSNEEVTVDVRVICATNRDLREFVSEKRFREDLYYRLSVFEVVVPPLREREADIALLLDHFHDHFRKIHGRPGLTLSAEARKRLLSFSWPGNVRQLRNVIDSAVVMSEGEEIVLDDLGIRDSRSEELETLNIEFWEQRLIKQALGRTANNVPQAAELLGISRATLYRKLEEYGISRT